MSGTPISELPKMKKPLLEKPRGADHPHCGRCGVEYKNVGGSNDMDFFVPNCPCWMRAWA